MSLLNIVRYNDKQLWQMIHEHLVMSGMYKTADTLLKEPQLQDIVPLVDSSQFSSGPPVSERDRANENTASGHVTPVLTPDWLSGVPRPRHDLLPPLPPQQEAAGGHRLPQPQQASSNITFFRSSL